MGGRVYYYKLKLLLRGGGSNIKPVRLTLLGVKMPFIATALQLLHLLQPCYSCSGVTDVTSVSNVTVVLGD